MADLTITVIEAPTRTMSCGGARSKVRWTAAGNGYIIQHIRVVNGRRNCFTNAELPLVGWTTPEYWECWKVRDGKVRYDGGARPKWDDCFEIPDQDRTRGSAQIIGEVKFFPGYTLGNVWKKNQVPEAGILRTTIAAPPGWDAAGALSHTLDSQWMCCRGKESGSVTGTPAESTERRTSTPAKRTLETLTAMPKWSKIIPGDRRATRAIEDAAATIGGFDIKAIRSAIRLYLDQADAAPGGPTIGDLSRIFVLNRYLFDVPPRAPLGEFPLFGGWHGVRSDRDTINPMWPWKMAGRRKRLAGSFKGYSGPMYRALAEFDYFRRRFPRFTQVGMPSGRRLGGSE